MIAVVNLVFFLVSFYYLRSYSKANNKSQEEEGINTSNNDKAFSIRLIPYIKCEYCNEVHHECI